LDTSAIKSPEMQTAGPSSFPKTLALQGDGQRAPAVETVEDDARDSFHFWSLEKFVSCVGKCSHGENVTRL
jgi:hypothetical protein